MQYDTIVENIQRRAGLDSREKAVRAMEATLEVLGQRLYGGEKNDLSAQLPEEVKDALERNTGYERFDLDEFYSRVGSLEGTDTDEAVRHARAVMDVIGEAVPEEELGQIRSQLPVDYGVLFEH